MGAMPYALAGLTLRFHIDRTLSEDLLEAKYKNYNFNRPRKERLKDGDLALARYLIRIAAADLRDNQLTRGLKPLEHLPFFRVSNPILADELGVTTRTIINRRDRLVKAGILIGYRFRTSKQKYDLRLSPEILHIYHQNCQENLSDWFFPQLDAPPGSAAYGEKFSQLCNQLLKLGPKERKQLEEGVAQPPVDVDDDFIFACLPAELVPKAGDTPNANQNPPPKTRTTSSETENSAAPVRDNPKYDCHGIRTAKPKYWHQVTEDLSASESRLLAREVDKLWAKCAGWNWFGGGFLAKSQASAGKVALAEWFLIRSPKIWKVLSEQYAKRIDLAAAHVQWREENGKQTWFPPPGQYFDIRSTAKFNFRNTRARYLNYLNYKNETAAKAQLTKAQNRLKIAGYSKDPYAVEVEYGRSLELLEKYGDRIMLQFQDYTISLYGTDLQP